MTTNIATHQQKAAQAYSDTIRAMDAVWDEVAIQNMITNEVASAYPDTLAGQLNPEVVHQVARLGEALVWGFGKTVAISPFLAVRRFQLAQVGLTPQQVRSDSLQS